MDDLISRTAAKQAVHDTIVSASTVVRVWDKINQIPAVDAAPVVHGRWVDEDFPYKDANANPRVTAICSVCGNVAHRMEHGYSILSKFCPACGAKMDGEANG